MHWFKFDCKGDINDGGTQLEFKLETGEGLYVLENSEVVISPTRPYREIQGMLFEPRIEILEKESTSVKV